MSEPLYSRTKREWSRHVQSRHVSPPDRLITRRNMLLLCCLVLFRLVNAAFVQTYFQPDEYWQSVEVANAMVYKYGYLTWEWRYGLRSIVHPGLFAGLFKILLWTGLDSAYMRIMAPRFSQAVFAAIADWHTYKLGRRLFGKEAGRLALLCTVMSAWNFYVSTRTFSNSLETVMTVSAMYYWPWSARSRDDKHLLWALSFGAIACVLRITNFLIWCILGVNFLFRGYPLSATIIFDATLVAVPTITLVVVIDSYYYGRLAFTALKFLQFNIVESLAGFYGRSPWHYYITQGIPMLTTTFLPFVVAGMWNYRGTSMNGLIVIVTSCYSLISHKEARFIAPLLPLMYTLSGETLSRLRPGMRRASLVFLLVSNLAISIYLSRYHQRGVMDVIQSIRQDTSVTSLGVLMPCHSTPWQSHLQRPDIDAWFLTCEPPIEYENFRFVS